MINVRELNAYLARKDLSKADGARIVGVTPKTFYSWLRKAVMPTDKAEILIKELQIDNPVEIFFDSYFPDNKV